jgi:hypothetical protein
MSKLLSRYASNTNNSDLDVISNINSGASN